MATLGERALPTTADSESGPYRQRQTRRAGLTDMATLGKRALPEGDQQQQQHAQRRAALAFIVDGTRSEGVEIMIIDGSARALAPQAV